MSKPINLLSLVQAKESLSDTVFENLKKHHCFDLKTDEISDLASLIKILIKDGCSIGDLDNFVVGYKIPQISKEFDLLRFGSECIINIELKGTGEEEKIKKQLIQNKYYLSFAGLNTHHYVYVSESGLLYKLLNSNEIEKTETVELIDLLQQQTLTQEQNLDDFFNPANYLISPFNSTERFLADEYFLTNQQVEVSDVIFNHLTEPVKSGFVALTGGAGTGKTLLAYHVAKKALKVSKKVLVIHCGKLNAGHSVLISNGWDIVQIRDYGTRDISKYDLVVIDEAQRLYISQFNNITHEVSISRKLCLLSFDELQTLSSHDDKLDINLRISDLKPISTHSLSEKIRSNKEIADFIDMFFSKNRNYKIKGGKNIYLKYFSTANDANAYLRSLDRSDWQQINLTPSQHKVEHHRTYFRDEKPTSHAIIGQEFDNVAIVIDQLFTYNESNQLTYRGYSYYNPRKMLFQNITRARRRILVVIINNEELLERCLQILGRDSESRPSISVGKDV